MFCAIEAKKDELFAWGIGKLLGQMKTLCIREKCDLKSFIEYCFIKILMFFYLWYRKPINGVLRDGLRWILWVSEWVSGFENLFVKIPQNQVSQNRGDSSCTTRGGCGNQV